jgi:cell division septation protein DedD
VKHTLVTFRLHRRGVFLIAVGAVVMGALLFAAGYLTALRRGSEKDLKDTKDTKDTVRRPSLQSLQSLRSFPESPAGEKKESPATPHIEDEAFTLRVGAFADETEAKALVQELTERGHKPTVVPVTTRSGVVLHTVRTGRYASREEAVRAAAELARKQGISSAVVAAETAGS